MPDRYKRSEDNEKVLFNRRSYLKIIGAASAPFVASQTASEAQAATTSGGYGEGGYGVGGYGGTSTESTLTVTTGNATDVTESAVELNGEVTDLGGASSVDVGFEFRSGSTTTWTKTGMQTLSAIGAFSTSINNLSSGTDYEFRAVVTASDGDTATGSIQMFTTLATRNAPSIDQFSVSESGSPNPHAEISISWQVADADADLRTVEIGISNESGQRMRTSTTDVNGESASGTDSFKIKQGGGTTYDCTLTVTDSRSQTASQIETVSA